LIEFPQDITIAFAVCGKECGNKEFIVSGSTQVCESCGNQLFRTEEREYYLTNEEIPCAKNVNKDNDNKMQLKYDLHLADYPDIVPSSVTFPDEIIIEYVICTSECGCSEFIIKNQSNICEYCGCNMHAMKSMKYTLGETD
jgi:hypothetical protein